MAQILTGRINLSKIPEALIRRNAAGEAFVWVDVAERREPSQYGDTHNISIYDSANRQKIYIGELRPSKFSKNASDNRESDNRIPPGGGFQGRDGKWHPLDDLYTDADKPAPTPAPAPIAPRPMNNAKAELDPSAPDDMPDIF